MARKSKSTDSGQNPLDPQRGGGLTVPPQDSENEKADVKRWQGIYQRTKEWRDQIAEKNRWKILIKEFKGDWAHIQNNVDIPLIPLNLVFAYCKTEIARLYFRDPWVSVNPKRIEDIGAARIAEQLINYTWGEIDLKKQFKLAILDALLIGHGWIKVGYTAETGTVESKPKEKSGNAKSKKKPDLDVNEYVKSENVFGYHVPWENVLFDPSATWPPTHNARWMMVETIKPLSVVKKCGLYTGVEDLSATELSIDERKETGGEGSFVKVIEIWDKENGNIKTITPNHPTYLRKPQAWPYEFDGYPLTMISFNPAPGEAYPLSDVAPWEGQVIEATKMMAIMLNHLKRWNRQVFIKRGMMTEEMRNKFKSSQDGAIIEYEGVQTDLFIPPYAPVQQDIYGVWNLIMDIFRNVSGQNEVDRGATSKSSTRTLGELQMQMQGSRGRAEEKIDIIEEAIEEVAKKLLAIMQQKFDLPKIVRIVGPKSVEKSQIMNRPSAQEPGSNAYTGQNQEGQVDSFSLTRKDIHGEMDVNCVAGSTLPLNRENQLEIMEKLTQGLEFVGIMPGSQAARAYGREMLRLINMLSLDQIMDIADEESKQQKPNPDEMKAQADIQGKQMDAQMKQQQGQQKMQQDQQKAQLDMQVAQQKAQLDLMAEKAKLESALMKAKADMAKTQMSMQANILQSLMGGGQKDGGQNGSGKSQ